MHLLQSLSYGTPKLAVILRCQEGITSTSIPIMRPTSLVTYLYESMKYIDRIITTLFIVWPRKIENLSHIDEHHVRNFLNGKLLLISHATISGFHIDSNGFPILSKSNRIISRS